ncbi:hypothetical protein P691DRAFT_760352 [Macrolepiota fuliginosa MF-IS2]|uniref:Uncharacterized protein n=1 Tax=Macrolepiota fuliginosa MF-IS2 TaxID=1400762 RepID=A0A9P5XEP2_9AGAR|nr:hypothetical protein P691DRAFT_760352 [Macrolepiota fuliginosa MF-IS2]
MSEESVPVGITFHEYLRSSPPVVGRALGCFIGRYVHVTCEVLEFNGAIVKARTVDNCEVDIVLLEETTIEDKFVRFEVYVESRTNLIMATCEGLGNDLSEDDIVRINNLVIALLKPETWGLPGAPVTPA